MKRILFILLITGLFWSSCERDSDIPLPQSDPKIALTGFLSPGQPVQITLVKVIPLFSGQPVTSPNFLSNGEVYFSDGSDTIQLVLSSNNNFYEEGANKIPVVQGKTYYVWASVPTLPSVSASCTVPDSCVKNFQLSHYSAYTGSDTSYYASMVWDDIEGQENFYRVYAQRIDSFVALASTYSYTFNTSYYNDFGRDGEEMQTSVGQLELGNDKTRHRYIHAGLLTCDENYFRYHLSIETIGGDDPFVTPVSLYSNVVGGVGCFGAYQLYTDIFKVF